MARLNESTAAPESIDTLKRRFVRQNREIARINSIQSLRIRSLESEVSHLLSENVSLRERVISLSQEIERLDEAKVFKDGIYGVKAKLDAKLIELSNLVTDLGALPHKFGKSCDTKAKSTNAKESGQSSSNLRRRTTNTEPPLGTDGGRLPVILEDKYYPRRTLEPEDVQDLINNELEIPVSLETDDAPINQPDANFGSLDPSCSEELETQAVSPGTDDDNVLPPTLEVRRKKRLSPASIDESSPRSRSSTTNSNAENVPKSGSKRKFDPDEDDKYGATSTVSDDGFEFSRSIQAPHESTENLMAEDMMRSPNKRQINEKRKSRNRDQSKRKVLAPKSTNIGVVPNRTAANSGDDKNQQLPDGEGGISMSRSKEPNHKAMRNVNANIGRSQPEELAQAATDLECPAIQNTPGATRPAAPLSESPGPKSGISELGVLSRTTRRQKPVVSYAEPNLRAKMRRPTTEFTDAVSGGRIRRSSSTQIASGKVIDKDEISDDSIGVMTSSCSPDTADNDPRTLPRGYLLNSLGDTVSQRKRRTLPAHKDDDMLDKGDMRNEDTGEKSMQLQKLRRRTSATNKETGYSYITGVDMNTDPQETLRTRGGAVESSAVNPVCGQGEPKADGNIPGQGICREKPVASQFDMGRPPLPAADTRRANRGKRVGTRRRSMML